MWGEFTAYYYYYYYYFFCPPTMCRTWFSPTLWSNVFFYSTTAVSLLSLLRQQIALFPFPKSPPDIFLPWQTLVLLAVTDARFTVRRALDLVGVGSGSQEGPAGGKLYSSTSTQVQFGGLRSEWDQVGVGSGCQAGVGCRYVCFCAGVCFDQWNTAKHQ